MTATFLRQRIRAPRFQGRYLPQLLQCEDRLSLGDALLSSVLGSAWLGSALTASVAESALTETAPPGRVLENPATGSFLIPSAQGNQERDAVSASSWFSSLDLAAPLADEPHVQSVQASRREIDLLAILVGTASYTGDGGGFAPSVRKTGGSPAVANPNRGQAAADLLDTFAGMKAPAAAPAPAEPAPQTEEQIRANHAKQPLHFEANLGQTDSKVQFLARGSNYTLFVSPTEAVMLPKQEDGAAEPAAAFTMQVVGGDPNVRGVGQGQLPGNVSYYTGNDPSKWVTDASTYAGAYFANVYDGIDLRYYGVGQQLEYDFIVSPGASPNTIRLAFAGADQIEIDAQGDLVLHSGATELRQPKPFTYQEVAGERHEVASAFVLGEDRQVSFQVGAYDAGRPLVIDPPILIYSTYIGGAGLDVAANVATDANTNAYVVGRTNSLPATFMTPTPLTTHGPLGGSSDAFLNVMDGGGNQIRTVYFGGSQDDQAYDVAVNSGPYVFIVGETFSCNFPTGGSITAYDTTCNGNADAFLTVLAPNWSLTSSTYFGGNGDDAAFAVAIFNSEWGVLTGETTSTNLPVLGAFQPAHSSGGSNKDAWVAELNPFFPGGFALLYSTYLGDAGAQDWGQDVAIDPTTGDTFVTGFTGATFIPSVVAWQCLGVGGGGDGFVLKLMIHTGVPVWYAHVGDLGYDHAQGIALDPANPWLLFVVGETNSPVMNRWGVPVNAYAGGLDAFAVTLIDWAGWCFPWTYTYRGGVLDDSAFAVAVSPGLDAHLTGYTDSPGFPVLNAGSLPASMSTFGGIRDAFAVHLDWSLTAQSSAFLGGPANDWGRGVAFTPWWTVYYAGRTDSVTAGTFPTQWAWRPAGVGAREGFLTHLIP